MSCFPCFRNKRSNSRRELSPPPREDVQEPKVVDNKKPKPAGGAADNTNHVDTGNINAQNFTFRDLATATKNFRQQFLLGEGGFGRVYKGTLHGSGQVVAVKQLDRNGLQEQKEFLVEVLMLSLLKHDNLVNLIGYCADGDQRLLVYEYMPGGSLDEYILDLPPEKKPLDWFTRMKIAYGAAQGLEYLHDKANPPVIYRDLKSSNILLDSDFNPKLSDFGLAKLGPGGDNKMPPASRVMGTYGYSAPEYTRTGQVTMKSDVFSFGVVLLELISGRRAIDTTKPINEQNLVTWAQPYFRDPKKFPELADPLLDGRFLERSLNQAVAIAAMCLQEEATARPLMSDVVTALSFLAVKEVLPDPVPAPAPTPTPEEHKDSESSDSESSHDERGHAKSKDGDSSDSHNEGTRRSHEKTDSSEDEHSSRIHRTKRLSSSKSSHHNSSRIHRSGSVSSSEKGSKRSHSRRKKVSMRASLSRKSSQGSDSTGSASFSKYHSTRKSRNHSDSSDDSDESVSSHRISSKNSRTRSISSSKRSHDGSVSPPHHSNSIASYQGEHYSYQFSHRKSQEGTSVHSKHSDDHSDHGSVHSD